MKPNRNPQTPRDRRLVSYPRLERRTGGAFGRAPLGWGGRIGKNAASRKRTALLESANKEKPYGAVSVPIARSSCLGALMIGAICLSQFGCEQASRTAKYPEGALQVRYEASTRYSGCLIACTAMAANYLLDKTAFTEASIRHDLELAQLDESLVGDVKKYLETKKLHLVGLTGRLDGKPPASLEYWVQERGYPAICVINRQPDSPGQNHAVLVIGISKTKPDEKSDRIHYLDPSSPAHLHSEEQPVFEANWSRGGYAMMIVVQPPPG